MDTGRELPEIPPTEAKPNEESIDTTEAELDASAIVMIVPKEAGSADALNSKMVSGNDDPEAKSKVDYVTYGINEIKQNSEKILSLLSTLQQQVEQQQQEASPVAEEPEQSGSILTEVDKKVQQILKCCTDLFTMEEVKIYN